MRIALLLAAVLLTCSVMLAEELPLAEQLVELDKQIAAAPEDPVPLIRKTQLLFQADRLEEGWETAQAIRKQLIAADKKLPWIMLERRKAGEAFVMILLNLGPDERRTPRDGIARPLSFRVFSEKALLEVIDFEIGYSDGKASTAALGQTTAEGHANFGILPVDAKYADIRAKALELIANRHPKPQAP